jgi:hypothetical protein
VLSGPIYGVPPTRSGTALSRDAVEYRLAKYVQIAAGACQSLKQKKVTRHVLRHTAAMRLRWVGIETSVIALWLGHEQIETTYIYLHAELEIKERAPATTAPASATPGRFRPNDKLLALSGGTLIMPIAPIRSPPSKPVSGHWSV